MMSRQAGFKLLRRSAENSFKSLKRSVENGFTLIEMMVALAVFSLAALALIRLESATIRGANILDSTLTAELVARNVAIEAVTDARPPVLGDTSGAESNGGRPWQWTRHVEQTGDARILRIDVTVADAGGAQRGRITMVRASVPDSVPTPGATPTATPTPVATP